MADEFQAEPPRPRRDWGDDPDARPVRRRAGGMPVWAWLLIGVGAMSLCLVPAVLLGGILLLSVQAPKPAPAPVAPIVKPAPDPVAPPEKAPRPQPDKEKVP